ncbi:MAG TPA: DUF397 domain-containing protein [Pseudonocardiaceae bacterium]|nr:DUF397 domain-containing protein [Pseudonocardiaceae bacterium]
MTHDPAPALWRKSTRSMSETSCVEVADFPGGHRAVRDSKNPTGPVLRFTSSAWTAFTTGIRTGEFG